MRFHTVLFYPVWNVNSSFAQYMHVLYTLTTHGQFVVFSNIRSTVIFPKDSSDGAANSDKPKKSHKVLPGGKIDQKKKKFCVLGIPGSMMHIVCSWIINKKNSFVVVLRLQT